MSQPPPNVPDYVSPKVLATPAPEALTPEQLLAIQRGHERARKIRRAVAVANADAAIMAVFAVLCLLSGFFDVTSLILGVALAVVTFNSFRGARGLKNYDRSAPKLLALNQLFLAIAVILYAVWSLYTNLAATTTDPHMQQIIDLDPSMGTFMKDTYRMVILALYISLIVGTIIAQGLTGLYYFTRGKHLATYLDETPPWVIEVQKRQTAK